VRASADAELCDARQDGLSPLAGPPLQMRIIGSSLWFLVSFSPEVFLQRDGTQLFCTFLNVELELMTCWRVMYPLGGKMGFIAVLDRAYFVRQIRTLLTFAKSTSDPAFAAFLLDKAVNLKTQAEEAPPARDLSPRPPDVEPEK